MPVASPCPAPEVLRRFAEHGGSAEELQDLFSHLEQCPSCAADLEELFSGGAAVNAIRSCHAVELPRGEMLEKLTERLHRLRPAAEVGLDHTLEMATRQTVSSLGVPADRTEAGLDFLAPAQQPNELGRLGHYRILRILGSGGMGMVFLAEDSLLGRKVALKTMLPALAANSEARERFMREARAAASIEHEHIVSILQVGEDNSVPYLAMPLLKGESLETRLEREDKLPVAEALRIAAEIAAGLAVAHAEGLIHRDIKPGNIWLEDRQGKVRLLDFGLARSQTRDSKLTQSGAIVGTPAFMAPEQAQGETIDGRADLFSLGAVLYVMLTGERPFQGNNTMAVLTALAIKDPAPPQQLNPHVPAAVSDLTMRLLAKEREKRPASAAEVAELITRLRAGTSASALPAAEPKASRPRRKRHLAGAAALVLLAGLVAGGIVVRIRTPDGKVREIPVPPGATVEIATKAKAPAGAKLPPPSPFDQLTGKDLPATDPPLDKTVPLVAVFGNKDLRLRHWGPVYGLAFSPDGSLLASASVDQTVKLWDSRTRQLKGTLVHNTNVETIRFSPDGQHLYLGSTDIPQVQVWKVQDCTKLRTITALKYGAIQFCVSPDGKKLAVSDTTRFGDAADGVKVLDVAGGTVHGHLKTPGPVQALAMSPEGKTLATASKDSPVIQLWNLDTLKEKGQLKGLKGPFRALAFHNRDSLLASVSKESKDTLTLWDWQKDTVRFSLPKGRVWNANGLVFLPQYNAFAVAGSRGWQLVDCDTGIKRDTRIPYILSVAYDPARKCLATGDHFGLIRLWNVENGKELLPPSDFHTIRGLDVSQDGTKIAALVEFSQAKVLEVPSGKELATIKHEGLNGIALSPDGQFLATVRPGGFQTRLWDLRKPAKPARILDISNITGPAIRFAPSGTHLAAGGNQGDVAIWNLQTGRHIHLPRAHTGAVQTLAFSPDGKTLASAAENPDQSIKFWDVDTGRNKLTCPDAFQFRVPAMAFSPDGKTLLSGNHWEGRARLWDVASGKLLHTFPHEAGHFLAFRPDGRQLAMTCMNRLRLWNAQTFADEGSYVLGPPLSDMHIAYAPDGRHLVTGNGNGTLYVLRLEDQILAKAPLAAAVTDSWLKKVAGLPAAQQVAAVVAALKELNPGFDGQVSHKIEQGDVVELAFSTDAVNDISPVRALKDLRTLSCCGSSDWCGRLSDLTPLKDLKLTSLICRNNKHLTDLSPLKDLKLELLDCRLTRVADLSPLKDMRLRYLHCYATKVTDLSPLKGMNLLHLKCGGSPIADLSPLKGMTLTALDCIDSPVRDLSPLKHTKVQFLNLGGTWVTDLSALKGLKLIWLGCHMTRVADLSPLKDMPLLDHLECHETKVSDLSPVRDLKLIYLRCDNTPISDLSPLRNMKLEWLNCQKTRVTDLSPLRGMPLKGLTCDFQAERDGQVLRAIKTLEKINDKPAALFWKELDARSAKEAADAAWLKKVAGMPAAQQVAAVVAALKERNPAFDGQVSHKIEQGDVVELAFSTDAVNDISPVRALKDLRTLSCCGSSDWCGRLSDLSPLKDPKLTSLICRNNKQLTDLSPLKDMKLELLDCQFSRVADLSPLKDMRLWKLDCYGTRVFDLSPLKNMNLIHLKCGGSPIADLSPLKGMTLTALDCSGSPVRDLSPLKHTKVEFLNLGATWVSDLSALKGLKLNWLGCHMTRVSDLSPLKNMPLKHLECHQTKIADLSPLRDLKLRCLTCSNTRVSDLSPLNNMKLEWLGCEKTRVTDLSPLRGMPLKGLMCDYQAERDAAILRSLPTLETINERPAKEVLK